MKVQSLLLLLALTSCAVSEPLMFNNEDGDVEHIIDHDVIIKHHTNKDVDHSIKHADTDVGAGLSSASGVIRKNFTKLDNEINELLRQNEEMKFDDEENQHENVEDIEQDDEHDNVEDEDEDVSDILDKPISRRLLAVRRRSRVFPVKMTVDNEFDLYINGRRIGSGNSWTRTYSFRPSFRRVYTVAVDGRDRGGPAAFIGVFNGRPTRARDWKCKEYRGRLPRHWMKNTFDDSRWPRARSYGRNNQNTIWRRVSRRTRPGIPRNAEWIWSRNNNSHNRVVCRMTLNKIRRITSKVGGNKRNVNNKAKIMRIRSGYSKISSYLKGIQSELRNDIKMSNRLGSKTHKQLVKYNTKVISLQNALIRTRKQLNSARNFNKIYTTRFNKLNRHNKSLLSSLKRQRSFIAVEHAYINKMEREALSLRKTSPHYKAIQNEIKQMRNQMKKEIRDVEAAYARALASSNKQKSNINRKRRQTNIRIRNLSRVINQYNVKHRQLQRLVVRIHRTEGINVFAIKALNNLNRVSSEFYTHVNDMSKRNMMLNYRAGYNQCRVELRKIRRFYRRAKCTKK